MKSSTTQKLNIHVMLTYEERLSPTLMHILYYLKSVSSMPMQFSTAQTV